MSRDELDPRFEETVGRDLAAAGRRLTRDILSRTSGPACKRARTLLPGLAEGTLAATDAALVRSHLAGCPACASLASTLAWIAAELPHLAEVAAPEGFAAAVLARTSGAVPARDRSRRPAADRPPERRWQRLLLRPHFAQEVAYAVLLALLLLTATPVSPLRQVPRQALEVVQAGPGSGLPALDAPLSRAGARAGAWAAGQAQLAWEAIWTAAADRVAGGAAAGAGELWRRTRLAAPLLGRAGTHLAGAASALLHLDVIESYSRLSLARQDLRRLWRTWSDTT